MSLDSLGGMSRHRRDGSHWLIAALLVGVIIVGGVGLAISLGRAQPAGAPLDESGTQAIPVQPTVAFLGDSYTQGAGGGGAENRWSSIVASARGWDEHNFGVGGTGFLNPGPGDRKSPYTVRVPEVIAVAPDILIISGGRNDATLPSDQVAGAVTDTVLSLRESLPDAQIVLIAPWWDDDVAPDRYTDIRRAIVDAATAAGATLIDAGEPLSGRSEYLSGDGVHPNADGYRAIADAVFDALDVAGVH